MTVKIATTKPSFDSKVPIASGITVDITRDAWENLGKTYIGLVELEVSERTEPSDFDADRKVKLRIIGIELAQTDDGADALRQWMRDMYATRTGEDSLFDQDDSDGGTTRDTDGRVTSVTFTSDDAERLGHLADRLHTNT